MPSQGARVITRSSLKHTDCASSGPKLRTASITTTPMRIAEQTRWTVTGTRSATAPAPTSAPITVPTLFSCGRVDEAAPGTTEWYHSLTPGSELETVTSTW